MNHRPSLCSFGIAFVWVLSLLGCPSSSDRTAQAKEPKHPIKEGYLTFPTVSLEGLTPEQLSSFAKLANEETCPCNCPKTFAECLQAGTKCKSAQILGQGVIDRIREGKDWTQLTFLVNAEISTGCNASPQTLDDAGYFAKGAAQPKVTIVEFADFDCSHCKTTASVLEGFVSKHSDKVRLVFKHFPLKPNNIIAACAVEAAGKQGKFWEMHNAAFQTTADLTKDLLMGHAKALGLNMPQFEKDLEDKDIIAKVERSKNEGLRIGIEGTPALFFNGRPFALYHDTVGLDTRLAMELAREESSCD